MKNLLKALVCSVMLMIVSIVLVSPSQSVLAVTTTANIFVDPSFNGAEFDAKTSIEVPVTIVKYDMYDRGRYYIDVMNKDGKVVASDHGSLTDLIVGTTNLTVFWNYSNKPHELGDYTVRYYTTNDTGGTVSFKVSSLSGTCGSKLNWTVDYYGALTITGTGKMDNYGMGDAPWDSQKETISSVTIEDGVTSIGAYAFYRCENIEGISIANSVKNIGNSAFYGCSNLEEIVLPSKIKSIDKHTFSDCVNLTKITIPIAVKTIDMYAFGGVGLEDVYYEGSKAMWQDILTTSSGNSALTDATMHYSMKPLAKVKVKSIKRTSDKNNFTMNWQKCKDADGYEIRISEYSDFHNILDTVKVKKNSTVKKSVNLTYSWKTYYVQIRSYKKVSGGYNYSTWSSTKILKGEY